MEYYDDVFCMTPDFEYFVEEILGILLVVLGIVLVFAIAFYVMQSLSMYTIAKRRGIHHPGLAWVPVANYWLIGCISDQYKYVTKGLVKSRRTVMLTMAIVSIVMGIFGGIVELAAPGLSVLFTIAQYGLGIALMVFWYMCLYDLYASCDPNNSVVFLVLSIILAVTEPFFMLYCRNKDKGMPPRKTAQPEHADPGAYQNAGPSQDVPPRWEPTPDRPDPWEQNREE